MASSKTPRCPACSKLPKRVSPVSDSRRCAFGVDGRFSSNNWNCATMEKLRGLVEGLFVADCWDEHCASIPFEFKEMPAFLILTWTKDRGTTHGAWIVQESKMFVLTLETAELILKTEA
jgi:hypothetical protein